MSERTTTARDIALRALRDRGGNVSSHLDRLLGQHELSSPDRRLARELAMGVARRRATLWSITRAYLKRPGQHLPPTVREAIRIALYQLLFLERVPDFAAVDEAVRQARKPYPRQAGMVNGLLRTFLRERGEIETCDGPVPQASNIVPLEPGRFIRLERDVLPDPEANFPEYLAAAYSLPAVLAERWARRLKPKKAIAVAEHGCGRPPLICRVNQPKATVPVVLDRLKAAGIEAVAHRNGRSIILPSGEGLTDLDVFQEGLIQPQDATATAVVEAARVRPGDSVLDFCAAPGTKTMHLALRMNDTGRIVASDVSEEKLERIAEGVERTGVHIVEPRLAPEVGALEPQSFDFVLVDAPCSNTGVLARRPEARWRFDAKHLSGLVGDQKFLAMAAAQFVRPGGQMIYSTCSIEPEENRDVVQWLAKNADPVRLVSQENTLPGGARDRAEWHDGGYYAIFEGR